jgi:NADP-dependent 3-hydroxy acid dehydrogenase YdfG
MHTCLVTGATGGIGGAVVRALLDRGSRVLAVGRSAERIESRYGDRVRAVPIDLAGPFEVPAELHALDRLDALVHCAGIADVASVEESGPDLWRRTLNVNVVSAAELTRVLLPALRTARGRVVFVNAAPGMRAVPRWSAYVASKAAQRALADALRAEEEPHGVRVTTIYPGGTATDLLARVRADFGAPYDPDACLRPETVASLVLTALDAPDDAQLTELSVRPFPGRASG